MSDNTPILAPVVANDTTNFVDLSGQERTDFLAKQAADELSALRQERDIKLKETDWWASSDLTMTTAQTNYRQALRDITNTYSSPADVVWPTKP